MVIRACEPRGSSWSADYRSYAVELYRQFEAGRITKGEMQLLLGNRYPIPDLPDERTLRRWAHDRYPDLPEQRRQILGSQATDTDHVQPQVLATLPVYQFLPPRIPARYQTPRLAELLHPMMSFVVALAMMRVAVSVGDYVGKSLNDILKGTT